MSSEAASSETITLIEYSDYITNTVKVIAKCVLHELLMIGSCAHLSDRLKFGEAVNSLLIRFLLVKFYSALEFPGKMFANLWQLKLGKTVARHPKILNLIPGASFWKGLQESSEGPPTDRKL